MVRFEPFLDLMFKYRNKETAVRDWFTKLQDSIKEWAQEARAAEAPDFDDTVSEYTSQSTTPTSVATSGQLGKGTGSVIESSQAKRHYYEARSRKRACREGDRDESWLRYTSYNVMDSNEIGDGNFHTRL